MTMNKVVVASAGSGKTTHLVNLALAVPATERVLITTFTESNEEGIRRKFAEVAGCIPANVHIETWFSVMLRHGIRPYQSAIIETDIRGMVLVNQQSALRGRDKRGKPFYWGEDAPERHYLSKDGKVYSDKIAKLAFRLDQANEGAVLSRLSRIYRHFFIDEVQDMAGYDLDIIQLLMKSDMAVVAVGDPRQITYRTHREARHSKYADGRIIEYFKVALDKGVQCEIDETSLKVSHRNSAAICELSSELYPDLSASEPCACCREGQGHEGLYVVGSLDVAEYLGMCSATQLRHNASVKVSEMHDVMTFGSSKGLGFDHVLIYPTVDALEWLKDRETKFADQTRARLYVGLTRARRSVGVVADIKEKDLFRGFQFFKGKGAS